MSVEEEMRVYLLTSLKKPAGVQNAVQTDHAFVDSHLYQREDQCSAAFLGYVEELEDGARCHMVHRQLHQCTVCRAIRRLLHQVHLLR